MDITNDRIQDDVRAELAGDPRLPYADEIAVEGYGGAITLRDAEIRGAALQRLIWDPEIPGGYLDLDVKDGWLTLKGEVDFQYQSDRAFDHATTLYGVTGVTNEIKVIQPL
jgi:osmotically-inducible protein OsmY